MAEKDGGRAKGKEPETEPPRESGEVSKYQPPWGLLVVAMAFATFLLVVFVFHWFAIRQVDNPGLGLLAGIAAMLLVPWVAKLKITATGIEVEQLKQEVAATRKQAATAQKEARATKQAAQAAKEQAKAAQQEAQATKEEVEATKQRVDEVKQVVLSDQVVEDEAGDTFYVNKDGELQPVPDAPTAESLAGDKGVILVPTQLIADHPRGEPVESVEESKAPAR